MRTTTRMTLAAGAAVALGSVPIGAVFEVWKWIWYVWAAIATIVAVSLLARSLRIPAALVPLAGALGLLVYLTVVFSSRDALLGLIPTPESVTTLWRDIGTGLEDVNALAAPVPATPGLILLCSVSIGAVALVVDVIAVSMRRPAAAGLALLALYAVPTAVARDGVPWVLFAIGACGYLLMLLVEGRDRLLRWGRPVGAAAPAAAHPAREVEDDAPLPLTGQRIGAFAIALAVVVPLLVPGLTGNALSRLGRTGTGDSGTGSGALSEFAELRGQLERGDPVELMKVRTSLLKPDYLRTKVLDRYREGTGFTSSRESADSDLPGSVVAPRGQENTSAVTPYTLSVELTDNYNDDHLPTYLAADQVTKVDGRWRYDADHAVVFSEQRGGNFAYEVTGSLPTPSQAQMEALPAVDDAASTDDVGSSGVKPTRVPAVVREILAKVTGGQSTDYAKAFALQEYFLTKSNGFSYAVQTVEGNGNDALEEFLTKKQGYCEQYAAAMAVMLRLADVPARVAIGYTPGVPDENTPADNRTYSVTTSDAHAWVEAYIRGFGWLRFDPTPIDEEGRAVAPGYAPRPSLAPTPSASAATGVTPGGTGPSVNQLPGDELEQDRNGGLASDDGLVTPRRLGIGAGVLAVLIALLAPAAVRLATRRRRLRTAAGASAEDAARAAWDEVVGSAADYGVPVARTETPRGLARRLSHDLSLDAGATAGLRLVALAEERARYAPRAGVDGDLTTAVRDVRRGLRSHADRRRRWQAVLLPPSTVRAARSGSAARSATASAALSRLGESVRRPVTPRRR